MAVDDRYNPARAVTPAFMERVAAWLEGTGEVLVILRYLRAAGANNFAICRTQQEFESLVTTAPRGTDIEVLRDRQLPMRGVVDQTFVDTALHSIPEGSEYLLLTTETEPGTRISRLGDIGNSHADLQESLMDLMGAEVALGPCPDFHCPDHEGLVSATKEGVDGPR